jgi:hypothetical protein
MTHLFLESSSVNSRMIGRPVCGRASRGTGAHREREREGQARRQRGRERQAGAQRSANSGAAMLKQSCGLSQRARKALWMQPRGKWMVSFVNFQTNASSKRWHL